MYGYNAHMARELKSDMWIERHVPGGLNGFIGEFLDNAIGGNPNPTYGQIVGGFPGVGGHRGYPHYGHSYGYGGYY